MYRTFPPSPQRIAHNRAASAGDSDLHNGHAFDWPMPRVSSFPAKLSDMQQTWQVKRLGQRPGFASSAAPLDEDDSEVTIDTVVARPVASTSLTPAFSASLPSRILSKCSWVSAPG